MKRYCFVICLLAICSINFAQTDMLQNARKQMMQGNYEEATALYKSALQSNSNNIEAAKEYAYMLCLLKNYTEAENIIKPFILNDSYDVQAAQIAGLSFKGQGRYDVAEQLYLKALTKFKTSAVLYSETGELYAIINKLSTAIVYWEKGITVDSNYGNNYYNAAMYYNKMQQQPLKIIWYGEIFANIESFTNKTVNIKEAIITSYKSLLNEKTLDTAIAKAATETEKQLGLLLAKNIDAVKIGITTETLTALRTRVILDWFAKNANNTPHKLLQQHQYLLRQGMFDAYNKWLFESILNPTAFALYKQTFSTEYANFEAFQKSRIFKVTL